MRRFSKLFHMSLVHFLSPSRIPSMFIQTQFCKFYSTSCVANMLPPMQRYCNLLFSGCHQTGQLQMKTANPPALTNQRLWNQYAELGCQFVVVCVIICVRNHLSCTPGQVMQRQIDNINSNITFCNKSGFLLFKLFSNQHDLNKSTQHNERKGRWDQ